jgi:hypothetical protein
MGLNFSHADSAYFYRFFKKKLALRVILNLVLLALPIKNQRKSAESA